MGVNKVAPGELQSAQLSVVINAVVRLLFDGLIKLFALLDLIILITIWVTCLQNLD